MGIERPGGSGGGGFSATIKSWSERVRKIARERRHMTIEEMVLREFAFLESGFGCAPPEIRRDTMFLIATWTASVCRVVVSVDMRDGLDVLVEPGSGGPGRHRYEIFAIRHYREHGDLDGYVREARAWKRPRAFQDELALKAAWVRDYAADLLRGDPSLYRGFDAAYRRVLEARENQRTEPGSTVTKVP